MLKELFFQQQQHLNTFFTQLDIEKAEEILALFATCEGMLIFTGVGKSGIVAKKIAVTMTSTGTRALFLSPTNALHGDLGIVNERDIFVFISKSGESDELLQLLPSLRSRQAKIVAIVSNEGSRIAQAADLAITIPLEKELCPFDMVPTTSCAIQMIFGDILAVAMMEKKGFGLDQYARNHPAGRIGKRITLKVKDLMVCGAALPTCLPHSKLVDILVELSDKRCGCVLVVSGEQELLGIFTDGDLRRALQQKGSAVLTESMESLMVSGARTVHPDLFAYQAMEKMESNLKSPITVLPVVDSDDKIHGLIKMHDLVQSGL